MITKPEKHIVDKDLYFLILTQAILSAIFLLIFWYLLLIESILGKRFRAEPAWQISDNEWHFITVSILYLRVFLFLLGYGQSIEQPTRPLSATSPSNSFLFPFNLGFVRDFVLPGNLILLCVFYIHCNLCVMVIWLQFRKWDWVVIWTMHTNKINEGGLCGR